MVKIRIRICLLLRNGLASFVADATWFMRCNEISVQIHSGTFYFRKQTRHLISRLIQTMCKLLSLFILSDCVFIAVMLLSEYSRASTADYLQGRPISFDQYCEDNSRSHCDENQLLTHTFLGYTKYKISGNLIPFRCWFCR